jgi:hypothetical protein
LGADICVGTHTHTHTHTHSNVKMLPFMVQLGYHSLGDAASAPCRQVWLLHPNTPTP